MDSWHLKVCKHAGLLCHRLQCWLCSPEPCAGVDEGAQLCAQPERWALCTCRISAALAAPLLLWLAALPVPSWLVLFPPASPKAACGKVMA